MSRLKFFILLLILTCLNSYPQSKYSIEGSLGIISPINSSSGLSGSGQLDYALSESLQLFGNVSYSAWDKYNVSYEHEIYYSEDPVWGPFRTFSADGHSLISISLGSRFKLHESKIINLLFDAQIGVSFFSYTKYNLNQVENPGTGQIDFVPDLSSPIKVNETLLSIGIGPIFEREINSSLSLFMSGKINTMLNTRDINFISKRGTYFIASAGFIYMI